MKCVEKDGEIRRVPDEQAFGMVKSGWAFCPKHKFRAYRNR